jgi:hypothetical protein
VYVIQVKILISSVFAPDLLTEGVYVEGMRLKNRGKISVSLTYQQFDAERLEIPKEV